MTKEEIAIAYFESMKKVLCEDYLKICPKNSIGYNATLMESECYDLALKALSNSKKPSGRWIPTGYDGYADGNPVYDMWECSNCGWEHNGELNSLTAFCPNCGFEMEVSNEDKPIMHYEELWDRLYNWLYDMRFSIAPDETVTDDNERKVRSIQVDLLDEIMEWMVDQVPKADGGGE